MKNYFILLFLAYSAVSLGQGSKTSLRSPGENFISIGTGGNLVMGENGGESIWGMGLSIGGGHYFTDNLAVKINLDYSFFFSGFDQTTTGGLIYSQTDDVAPDVYFYDKRQNQFSSDILLMVGTSFRERSNMYLLLGPGMTFKGGKSSAAFSAGAGYSVRIGNMSSLNIEGVYRTGLGGYFPIRVSFSQGF